MKKICILSFSFFIFISCSSKFSIQKRRYTKGFYFASSKKANTQVKKLSPEIRVNEESEHTKVVVPNSISKPATIKVFTTKIVKSNRQAKARFCKAFSSVNGKSLIEKHSKIMVSKLGYKHQSSDVEGSEVKNCIKKIFLFGIPAEIILLWYYLIFGLSNPILLIFGILCAIIAGFYSLKLYYLFFKWLFS